MAPLPPPERPSALSLAWGLVAWQRSWPLLAAAVGGGLLLDFGLRLSHLSLSAAAGSAALLAGGWWLLRRRPGALAAQLPTSVAGWLQRLEQLQGQFQVLAPSEAVDTLAAERAAELAQLRQRLERPGLQLALVGRQLPPARWQRPLAEALRSRWPLSLHWGHPLPGWQPQRPWPHPFGDCELLLYHLHWPLAAADLRWLQAIPADLPVWLWLADPAGLDGEQVRAELAALLPERAQAPLLLWDGSAEGLQGTFAPLAALLESGGSELRQTARLRALAQLHGRWQAELEGLRRHAFERLQQRTQWLVAAGVVASPVASVDLLVLAVANGLMLRQMARLWGCDWSAEQLQAAAAELAKAALAFGVVDWSTQALAGLARWHGATWLVGSAVQALSAAYLTRVVGRAMADLLARSVGVSEPDLERIKREAPLVVAAAAEAEKLDWSAFLQQGRQWLAAAPAA
ncbi:MAG: YcjF family protein [Synechococcaceae cyanobacterium]|nr:YcjF family protein [Synechococcaceae cyanobacterium]